MIVLSSLVGRRWIEVHSRRNIPFEPRSWVNGFDGKAIITIKWLHCFALSGLAVY